MFSTLLALAGLASPLVARGPSPRDITSSPQEMGSSGIVWYAKWADALAEAQRSQRPIFFMVAAAQCNGISGVF